MFNLKKSKRKERSCNCSCSYYSTRLNQKGLKRIEKKNKIQERLFVHQNILGVNLLNKTTDQRLANI